MDVEDFPSLEESLYLSPGKGKKQCMNGNNPTKSAATSNKQYYHHFTMFCNSSTANSGLANNISLTLDTAHAVTANHVYSNDPPRIPEAYTYYWEPNRKPPDNTSAQLLATLGIMGYTILVVYVTWKLCNQQRKQSPCQKRQKYQALLSDPSSSDVADPSQSVHPGSSPFAFTTYGTGTTPSVQKDALFVFGKPTKTTAVVAPTSFSPLGSKSSPALDLKGSSMKFQQQRARHTLNDPLFYDPEEFKGMTVKEAKTALATSLSNKWRHTNNDVRKDVLFVFGKPTNSTAFRAPPPLSPLGPIPLFKPTRQFPMKSAAISTYSVLPEAGFLTQPSSLFAWPITPTDTSSKTLPALYFERSAADKVQHQRVQHEAKNRPPANKYIESLRNNRPDECTKKEWNQFVNKNWTMLLNHVQNRPKRLYRAKILTSHERQLLLEADIISSDPSTITQQTFCIAKMKAAWRVGSRRCSHHHQSRFHKSARHHKPISPILMTTNHCYKLSRPHRLTRLIQQDIIKLPHHIWSKTKRERTDSEAVTNSSNKRLRKPD